MGGRAAEELFLGTIGTGALNDMQQATRIARSMVMYYGMSEKMPNISYYDPQGQLGQRPYSDERARLIDEETSRIVNEQYERAKKLISEHAEQHHKMVDAYIIGWSSTDWENTFTINRGTAAGIQENMCAITANGEVVGLVTSAGVNYAEVTTVLDSTLEISGTIASSGYNGMVRGGYIDGHQTLLQMNYLPSAAIIRNKEQVVTSGSTVYPRGLIMGNVVDAGFEETGIAKYALLDPAAEINSLEQIFIITEYTTESVTPATTVTEATQPTVEETTEPVGGFG